MRIRLLSIYLFDYREDFYMDSLKKLFPVSFKRADSGKNLAIGIVIYLVIGILAGLAIGLAGLVTGWIPVVGALVGWVLRIAGIIIDLYVIAGIVLQVLLFAKIIKE